MIEVLGVIGIAALIVLVGLLKDWYEMEKQASKDLKDVIQKYLDKEK